VVGVGTWTTGGGGTGFMATSGVGGVETLMIGAGVTGVGALTTGGGGTGFVTVSGVGGVGTLTIGAGRTGGAARAWATGLASLRPAAGVSSPGLFSVTPMGITCSARRRAFSGSLFFSAARASASNCRAFPSARAGGASGLAPGVLASGLVTTAVVGAGMT